MASPLLQPGKVSSGRGDFHWECLDSPNPLPQTAGLATAAAAARSLPASGKTPCSGRTPRARPDFLARKQPLGSASQRIWDRIWGKHPRQPLMAGNIPPMQTIRKGEAPWANQPGHQGLAPSEAQHPPPSETVAPTVQRKREGAGGRLGEAPGCCQAFPFKARARSGYSLFPPALTTNPLPSSSLPGPRAHIPSGTAPGRWGRQPGHGMPAPRGDRSIT